MDNIKTLVNTGLSEYNLNFRLTAAKEYDIIFSSDNICCVRICQIQNNKKFILSSKFNFIKGNDHVIRVKSKVDGNIYIEDFTNSGPKNWKNISNIQKRQEKSSILFRILCPHIPVQL